MPVEKIPIIQNWQVEKAEGNRLKLIFDVEYGRVPRQFYIPEYMIPLLIESIIDKSSNIKFIRNE